MKTKLLILGSMLALVTLSVTILIDAQRDTPDHDLKVTRQSGSTEKGSPATAETGIGSFDDDLGTNVMRVRVAVTMVKTDEAHLHKFGYDWLLDHASTAFRVSDWSEYPISTEAEQGAAGQPATRPESK